MHFGESLMVSHALFDMELMCVNNQHIYLWKYYYLNDLGRKCDALLLLVLIKTNSCFTLSVFKWKQISDINNFKSKLLIVAKAKMCFPDVLCKV